jgi:hypothetical protein
MILVKDGQAKMEIMMIELSSQNALLTRLTCNISFVISICMRGLYAMDC